MNQEENLLVIYIIILWWLCWSYWEVGKHLSIFLSLIVSFYIFDFIFSASSFLPGGFVWISGRILSFLLEFNLIWLHLFLLYFLVSGPDINLLGDGNTQGGGSLCPIDFFFGAVGVNLIATITFFLQKMVLFGKTIFYTSLSHFCLNFTEIRGNDSSYIFLMTKTYLNLFKIQLWVINSNNLHYTSINLMLFYFYP